MDIISKSGLLGGKPILTPMKQNHKFAHATGELLHDVEPYRRLVGFLIYLQDLICRIVYMFFLSSCRLLDKNIGRLHYVW